MHDTQTSPYSNLVMQRRAEAMLLLTTLIWGGTFGITKALLDGSMRPLGLLVWRFGIAAVVFPVFYGYQLRNGISRQAILRGGVLGMLLYLGFALQTMGLSGTSSSRSGFITALYVVFTPLLQVIVTRRAPSRPVMAGVALVLLGLWGLTAPGGTIAGLFAPWQAGGFGVGDLLTLACALVFAVYIILLDRFAPKAGEIAPMTWVQLLSATILLSAHRLVAEPWTMPSTVVEWGGMLYLAILATVLSTYWQTRYQPMTSPTRASVIFTMESVFAAILAAIFLNEWLGPVGIVGGVLIVAGLLVAELGGLASKQDGTRIERIGTDESG
jgi:drug/metabolite transporter (DMT)-like permease